MGLVIEADAEGRVILPLVTTPGTRYTVEQIGESVTVRPEKSNAQVWWDTTTAEERIAWLSHFVNGMAPGVGLKIEEIAREDLY